MKVMGLLGQPLLCVSPIAFMQGLVNPFLLCLLLLLDLTGGSSVAFAHPGQAFFLFASARHVASAAHAKTQSGAFIPAQFFEDVAGNPLASPEVFAADHDATGRRVRAAAIVKLLVTAPGLLVDAVLVVFVVPVLEEAGMSFLGIKLPHIRLVIEVDDMIGQFKLLIDYFHHGL